ncbi:MAG TPA: GYD domain-containing protein [Actinomycetes bacterium]
MADLAKYLVQASYRADGSKAVLKEGASKRVGVVKAMTEGLGGSMEAFYFGFGDSDLYVLADLPDNTAAAAVAAAVWSSGALSSYQTTVLLTAEEIDAAAKMALSYRPPGS